MKTNNILIVIGLILIPLFSCQSQTSDKKNQKTDELTKNKMVQDDEKKSESSSVIEHLTSATFKQKVFNYEASKEWKFLGTKPAIIDFYADWCGPCKRIAPTVAQIAEQYKGKVDVYKINVDNEQELASGFGISGIPAILFIPLTGQPQMSTGLISKEEFDRMIKDYLKVN